MIRICGLLPSRDRTERVHDAGLERLARRRVGHA
jgi:hypothetical protein